MFHGGPKLQGYTQNVLSDSLTVLWKFKTDDEINSSPVIADGLVFVGSSDANVYAIDLEDGDLVWSYKTDGAVEAAATAPEYELPSEEQNPPAPRPEGTIRIV